MEATDAPLVIPLFACARGKNAIGWQEIGDEVGTKWNGYRRSDRCGEGRPGGPVMTVLGLFHLSSEKQKGI
jgi:hypothetical protein